MNNKKIYISLFSVLFGAISSIAYQIKAFDNISFNIFVFFFSFLACFVMLNVVIRIKITASNKTKKINFVILFICFFISYSICWLTYFPGVGMNDGLNILNVGMSISIQFPILYVLFIRILKAIGEIFNSMQLSIILYSFIQIIAVSAISSWLVTWIYKKKVHNVFKVFCFIYLLLSPIVCMYAISMLKDTLFSLFVLVLFALIYDLSSNELPDSKYWILFAVTSISIAVLRNNGPYISVITIFVLLMIYREYRKQLTISFVSVILTISFCTIMTNRYHSGHLFRESVGIPLQQICAVFSDENGDYTISEKEFIENIITVENIKKQYNPYSVDDIKFHNFDADYLQDYKSDFINLWLSLLKRNFNIYVESYLKATYDFWSPIWKFNNKCSYSIISTAGSRSLEEFIRNSDIKDDPIINGRLKNILDQYYHFSRYGISEGPSFWIMIICLYVTYMKKHDKKIIACYLPMIILWITIMISTPISGSIRYVFSFVYGFPFFISLVFDNN